MPPTGAGVCGGVVTEACSVERQPEIDKTKPSRAKPAKVVPGFEKNENRRAGVMNDER